MLARANRVVLPADFRSAVRRGRRTTTPSAVYYQLATDPARPLRFGFIVSKAVGNSVVRHRVTRRLRAIGHDLLSTVPEDRDVIIRSLPGSDEVAWATLHDDVARALAKVTEMGGTRR